MITKKIVIALFGLASAATLISCTSSPASTQPKAAAAVGQSAAPADLKATYEGLAKSGGKVYTLDPKTSAVRIYVFRGGMATKLGHNHVLSAPQFDGFVHMPPGMESDARFDLAFRFDQLEIDNTEYRSGLGKAFSTVLNQAAIDGTRDHMLGEDNMQADRYPTIRIHSVQITGEAPRLAAKVQVEMHGQTREMWVPLSADIQPEHITVSGSFVLRQTDFGAQPYSVLGGLLAVKDEVVIDFKLSGS